MPTNVTSPITPLSTSVSRYWLSKTSCFGAYHVPIPRPSQRCWEMSCLAVA